MRNPKIRYYLEAKSKEVNLRTKHELIMAEINYGYRSVSKSGKSRNTPFRITLEATILPKNFGDARNNYKFNEEVFKRFSRTNATIKTKMYLLETAINKLTNNYLINSITPRPDEFKNALKLELGQLEKIVKPEKTILDFVYDKIKADEESLKIGQKKGIAKGTIKSYVTLSHHIENYQIATNDVLTFSNFDENRYWNFWKVINEIYKDKIKVDNPNQKRKQPKDENGYASSAIQKNQKNLLRVLRIAKKEHSPILDLDDESLVLKDSESMKDFYINETELQKIIDSDVSFDLKLTKAKEYAIISGLTGMRCESMLDTVNIEVQTCTEDNYNFQYINSLQNKTSTEVYIPLLEPVRKILDNYGGMFPEFPANQTINEYLKDLFAYLKIDDEVILTKDKFSDDTIISKVPKSSVVSTHDFKHSFYSNLYKHKVRQSVIDNITHPDKTPKNPMAKIYNKSNRLDRAKMFVDEINKINSSIYKM